MDYTETELIVKEAGPRVINMKVITQTDPLAIRNIPSLVGCEVLGSVERGGTVIWSGDVAFGSGRQGGTEPWIKVETLDGVVGWTRLIYLCPADEEDFELKLHIN